MTKIIAFAGRKQSGKTTSSEMIKDYCTSVLKYNSQDIIIYNFADLLKQEICINILGLTYEQCYGDDDKKNELTDLEWDGKKLTAREAMQFIGTDIFRKMKNNVWSDATLKKINNDKPLIAVIADCRFPNEVEVVKSAGGLVIKLMLNPFNSNHSSEVALDANNYDQKKFDLVVYNNNLEIQHKNYAILTFLNKKGIFTL